MSDFICKLLFQHQETKKETPTKIMGMELSLFSISFFLFQKEMDYTQIALDNHSDIKVLNLHNYKWPRK